MKKLILITIILLSISGLAIAQLVGNTPVIPPQFTIVLDNNQLPPPLPGQKLGACDYIFPIEIKNVEVWNALPGAINMSFGIYADNRRCNQGFKATEVNYMFGDPVQTIENYVRQEVISSIKAPIQPLVPIGGASASYVPPPPSPQENPIT